MRHSLGMGFLSIFALMSVPSATGCSVALAGDAIENCHTLEDVLRHAAKRCGGHGPGENVLQCDTVIASNMTAEGVEKCRQRLEADGCDAIRGESMPSECVFAIDHL